MKGISINLLPTENTILQRKLSRVRQVKIISIAFLLMLFFLSSVLITLRILQTQEVARVQTQAQASEGQISNFRDKESTLVLLKDRLTVISRIKSAPSKQKKVYDSFTEQLPPSIEVSAVSLDSAGNLNVSTISPDSRSLTNFLADLTSEESFEKIASVSVESLSRGRDGSYRISLRLVSK